VCSHSNEGEDELGARHVACMQEMWNANEIVVGKFEGKGYLEDILLEWK
jgi:hypothetical protein